METLGLGLSYGSWNIWYHWSLNPYKILSITVPLSPLPLKECVQIGFSLVGWLFFFVFDLFRAAPAACGVSEARHWIGATAAGPPHSHSNARSQACRWPTPQLTAIPIFNPLSEARDWTCVLMDTSQIRSPLNHNGNSQRGVEKPRPLSSSITVIIIKRLLSDTCVRCLG